MINSMQINAYPNMKMILRDENSKCVCTYAYTKYLVLMVLIVQSTCIILNDYSKPNHFYFYFTYLYHVICVKAREKANIQKTVRQMKVNLTIVCFQFLFDYIKQT